MCGRWVLAAAILGSSITFIDGTVINVALAMLQRELGASVAQAQWIVELYARRTRKANHALCSKRKPFGTISRSANSKTPCAKSASAAAGIAPCMINPMSSSLMPVNMGWP
jgi:hypothetical protein